MPVSDSTKKNRETKIIEAAKRLFIQKSFSEVSMDNIAKEAKMVKATLYKYFSSKEDLYFVVSCITYNERWQLVKPNIIDDKTGLELIIEFMDNFIEHAYENPHLFHFLTNSNQQFFELLFLRDDVKSELREKYWYLIDEAFNEYREMFNIGFKDKSVRNFADISIDMYFIYTLRGYLLERVIAITKFKKHNTDTAHDNFIKMIKKEIKMLRSDLIKKISNVEE